MHVLLKLHIVSCAVLQPHVVLVLVQVQAILPLTTSLLPQHCPVFDAGAGAAAAVH